MENDLKIEAVLEDELYNVPPLMRVIVARITGSKQDIPRAFKLTKDLVSNAELKHLRRIRDLEDGHMECIVCRSDSNDKDESVLIQNLKERFEHENLFTDYHSKLVPSKAPRTEHQWTACTKIWPCKYAKSIYLIQCMQGSVFNLAERLVLKIMVDSLLGHFAKTNDYPHRAAAVIFRFAKVYGVGLTNIEMIKGDPTKHCPMLAIDSVAENAGAGFWTDTDNKLADKLAVTIQQQLEAQQHNLKEHNMESSFLPYLCTNYDIVVTEEPCMMCTMGLIQSRIRRLFYLDLKSLRTRSVNLAQTCYPDGAIERFFVHRDKNLNHRFEAWRIKLNPELQ